jgi:hypothetical protein
MQLTVGHWPRMDRTHPNDFVPARRNRLRHDPLTTPDKLHRHHLHLEVLDSNVGPKWERVTNYSDNEDQ